MTTLPIQEDFFRQLSAEECAVCQNPLNLPTKTLCNHWFCMNCLQTWLQANNTCPMCRTMLYIRPATSEEARQALNTLTSTGPPSGDALVDPSIRVRIDYELPFADAVVAWTKAKENITDEYEELWERAYSSIEDALDSLDNQEVTPLQLYEKLLQSASIEFETEMYRAWPQYSRTLDPNGGMFEKHVCEVMLMFARRVFRTGLAYNYWQ